MEFLKNTIMLIIFSLIFFGIPAALLDMLINAAIKNPLHFYTIITSLLFFPVIFFIPRG